MIYLINGFSVTLNTLINYSGFVFITFFFSLAFIRRIIIICAFFNIIIFLFSSTFIFTGNINLALMALAA